MIIFCELCNFADDNSLYAVDNEIENVIKKLLYDLEIALEWFKNNEMVANPDKFQVIFPKYNAPNLGIYINNTFINASESVKLLGITIDKDLTFLPHIKELCSKTNLKTKALLRMRNRLCDNQAKILYNAYILSQLIYCPIVWMFTNKEGYKLISRNTKNRRRCFERWT